MPNTQFKRTAYGSRLIAAFAELLEEAGCEMVANLEPICGRNRVYNLDGGWRLWKAPA